MKAESRLGAVAQADRVEPRVEPREERREELLVARRGGLQAGPQEELPGVLPEELREVDQVGQEVRAGQGVRETLCRATAITCRAPGGRSRLACLSSRCRGS